MLLNGDLWLSTAATVVLWALSGTMSIMLGLVLAAGSLSSHHWLRIVAHAIINVTRGIPTSLLVIAAGIGMMRVPIVPQLPTIFPCTPNTFQHVGWGIVLALALGSSGHLAMIFRAAVLALGRYRREQGERLSHAKYPPSACINVTSGGIWRVKLASDAQAT